jgi:hypothetical protein
MSSEPDNEIDELARMINADPDVLHSDYTPAVNRLIAIGEPALPTALDLMLSEDEMTRLRAQRVIEGVTMRMHGFQFGQGWTSQQGSADWESLWNSLGDMDYQAPLEYRHRALKLWKDWLSRQTKG